MVTTWVVGRGWRAAGIGAKSREEIKIECVEIYLRLAFMVGRVVVGRTGSAEELAWREVQAG